MNSIKEGNIIGNYNGLPVYKIIVNGKSVNIAVVIGDNGFIVSSYPVSTSKIIPIIK